MKARHRSAAGGDPLIGAIVDEGQLAKRGNATLPRRIRPVQHAINDSMQHGCGREGIADRIEPGDANGVAAHRGDSLSRRSLETVLAVTQADETPIGSDRRGSHYPTPSRASSANARWRAREASTICAAVRAAPMRGGSVSSKPWLR